MELLILTPGILLRLPPKGSKWVVAAVHGLVFAFVFHLAYQYYFKYQEGNTTMNAPTQMHHKIAEKNK